jgi:hypothetical protein
MARLQRSDITIELTRGTMLAPASSNKISAMQTEPDGSAWQ